MAVLAPVAVAAALWVVWVKLPNSAVDDKQFEAKREITAKDGNRLEEQRLKARSDTRTAGAQILGVLAVVVGGLATWWTVRLTREGQITDRYASAIEHLGEKYQEPAKRLGGIYALERIARDSARDHWPIMELLVGHLRETTPLESDGENSRPVADVSAVATVLVRRKSWRERKDQILELWRLDLRGVRLNKADLRRANFARSDLSGAYLESARLDGAHLEGSVLRNARLRGAKLRGASLGRADFVGADLRDTDFTGAETMPLARFYETIVDGASGLPRWAIQQAAQREPPGARRSGGTPH